MLHSARPRGSGAAIPADRRTDVDSLLSRDENGIPGWVGLMRGDVEVLHAEREIDRVDVFERAWEKWEVRRQEDERKRRDGCAHGAR